MAAAARPVRMWGILGRRRWGAAVGRKKKRARRPSSTPAPLPPLIESATVWPCDDGSGD